MKISIIPTLFLKKQKKHQSQQMAYISLDDLIAHKTQDWSKEEVLYWLKCIGMEGFADQFKENMIDGETLLNLSTSDIHEIGIDDEHCLAIAMEINKLVKQRSRFSLNTTEQIIFFNYRILVFWFAIKKAKSQFLIFVTQILN